MRATNAATSFAILLWTLSSGNANTTVSLEKTKIQKTCHLARPVISLSSPVTDTLEELRLLSDPQLRAISSFHYTPQYKGQRIAGGVNLSARKIKHIDSGVLFFDESASLSKALEPLKEKFQIEKIKTTGQDPFEAAKNVADRLESVLSDCEEHVAALRRKLRQKKKAMTKAFKGMGGSKRHLFFLGSFDSEGRPPEGVLGRDGPVLFLRSIGLKSYPTPLAYASWSEKKLKEIEKRGDSVWWGLGEDRATKRVEIISDPTQHDSMVKINVVFPKALHPGLGQISFLEQLVSIYSEVLTKSLPE